MERPTTTTDDHGAPVPSTSLPRNHHVSSHPGCWYERARIGARRQRRGSGAIAVAAMDGHQEGLPHRATLTIRKGPTGQRRTQPPAVAPPPCPTMARRPTMTQVARDRRRQRGIWARHREAAAATSSLQPAPPLCHPSHHCHATVAGPLWSATELPHPTSNIASDPRHQARAAPPHTQDRSPAAVDDERASPAHAAWRQRGRRD